MPLVIIVYGASGAGKTFLVDSAENAFSHERLEHVRFDRIGVPSAEGMIREHGSPEAWQRWATMEWVRRFVEEGSGSDLIIFEGQFNLEFACEACEQYEISHSRFVVLTVPDSVMAERLTVLREQPELVTDDMRNWSRVLRDQGERLGALLIDTSELSASAAVTLLLEEDLALMRDAG